MPVYYLDTSVILKRYRDEEGTEVVDQLLLDSGPEDRCYTSFLSALEVRAAISRLIRSGQLDRNAAERLLARFLEDSHQVLQTWPLDNSILESAINVADRHGLRSGDAIHLATAASIFQLAPELENILVSNDRDLLQAAIESGMGVMDPQHPGK